MMAAFTATILLFATAAAEPTEVDTAQMWQELEAHCAKGLCALAEGTRADTDGRHVNGGALWEDHIKGPTGPETDCKGRMLAYEYGLKLLPSRKPQLESFDALELHTTCGVTRPTMVAPAAPPVLSLPDGGATFHVDAAGGNDFGAGRGDAARPFRTIHRALAASRAVAAPKKIVLAKGVHFLNATIELGAADSGLTITAAPGLSAADVTVSGGALLEPTWKKSSRAPPNGATAQIWETSVPAALAKTGFKGLTTLKPHRRVTRKHPPLLEFQAYLERLLVITGARYPNAGAADGAELCTKGCWANGVSQPTQATPPQRDPLSRGRF